MFQKCVSLLSSETESLNMMGTSIVDNAIADDKKHATMLSDFLLQEISNNQTREQSLQAIKYLVKFCKENSVFKLISECLLEAVIETNSNDEELQQILSNGTVTSLGTVYNKITNVILNSSTKLSVRELCSLVLRNSNYKYDEIPESIKSKDYQTPEKSLDTALLLSAAVGFDIRINEIILDKLHNMATRAVELSTESPSTEVYPHKSSTQRLSSTRLPREAMQSRQLLDNCSIETASLLNIIVNAVVEIVEKNHTSNIINKAITLSFTLINWKGLVTSKEDEIEGQSGHIFQSDEHDDDLRSESSNSDTETDSTESTEEHQTEQSLSPTSLKHSISRQTSSKALSILISLLVKKYNNSLFGIFQQHLVPGTLQQLLLDQNKTIRMNSLKSYKDIISSIKHDLTRLTSLDKSRIIPHSDVRNRIHEWSRAISSSELIKQLCSLTESVCFDCDDVLLCDCLDCLNDVLEIQVLLVSVSDGMLLLRHGQVLAICSCVVDGLSEFSKESLENIIPKLRSVIQVVCHNSLPNLPPKYLRQFIVDLSTDILPYDFPTAVSVAITHRLCLSLSTENVFFNLVTQLKSKPSELAKILISPALSFIPYDTMREALHCVINSLTTTEHKYKTLLVIGESNKDVSSFFNNLTASQTSSAVASCVQILRELRTGNVDLPGLCNTSSKQRLISVRESCFNFVKNAFDCGKKVSSVHLKHIIRELQPFLGTQTPHWEIALPLCGLSITMCKAHNNKHVLSQYVSALVFPRCVDIIQLCSCSGDSVSSLKYFFSILSKDYRQSPSSVVFDLFALSNIISLSLGVLIKIPTFARKIASQESIPVASSIDTRLSFLSSNSVGCPNMSCQYICDDPLWDNFVSDCLIDPPSVSVSNFQIAGKLINEIITTSEINSTEQYTSEQHYYETVCFGNLKDFLDVSERLLCLSLAILQHSHSTVDKPELLSVLKNILENSVVTTNTKALATCCAHDIITCDVDRPVIAGDLLREIGFNFSSKNNEMIITQVKSILPILDEDIVIALTKNLLKIKVKTPCIISLIAEATLLFGKKIRTGVVFEKLIRELHRESAGEIQQLLLVEILGRIIHLINDSFEFELFHHTIESLKALLQLSSPTVVKSTLMLLLSCCDIMCDRLVVHIYYSLCKILSSKSSLEVKSSSSIPEHADPEIEDEINNIFGLNTPDVDLTQSFRNVDVRLRTRTVLVLNEKTTVEDLLHNEF